MASKYGEREAVNFIVDKVGEPYITRYINHVSSTPQFHTARHAIILDLHARNFPTGRQQINDSGATLSAEAIFEVKTYTPCPSRYNHNNATIKPAERRV